ncbi:hypothetical protein Lser_V15G01166 [Lactuca serriola]
MIIWDEAPMSDRRCFEFLDKSLKDVLENDNHLFGGMLILLGGGFRQTLPVQPKSRKSQIIFASWLLDIGNGNIETPERNDPESTNIIQIPQRFLIQSRDKALESLIHFVYGKDIISNPSPQDLSVRAIIRPKNETVDQVNALILSKTGGQGVVYNSCDSIKSQTHDNLELDALYPKSI